MTLDKGLNYLGLALLLICFGISMVRVAGRHIEEQDPSRTILRVAHRWLYDGLKGGLEEAISEYEELHPNVDVRQMPVPLEIWYSWRKTRLLAGHPPDIMMIDRLSDEERMRYIESLSEHVEEPNPYNRGTELEGVPWRNTFLNGLTASRQYSPELLRVDAVPLFSETIRLFYNQDLLMEATGSRHPPDSLEAFLNLCRKIQSYSKKNDLKIVPIAVSDKWSFQLIRLLFEQLTQKLAIEESQYYNIRYSGFDLARSYLKGDWRNHSSPVVEGWQLYRELGEFFQSGFLYARRDEPAFRFRTGVAVFMLAGSWDYEMLTSESLFPVGITRLPFPLPGEEFGEHVLGRPSEAFFLSTSIGVARQSKHYEQAVDFIQFLSSKGVNRGLCRKALRPSAIVGVNAPDAVKEFEPFQRGYPIGFSPLFWPTGSHLPNAADLIHPNLYRIFDPSRGMDEFLSIMAHDLMSEIVKDLHKSNKRLGDNLERDDSVITAYFQLKDQAIYRDRMERKIELNNLQEAEIYQNAYLLERDAPRTAQAL